MTDEEKRKSSIETHVHAKFTVRDIIAFSSMGGAVALLGGISLDPSGAELTAAQDSLAQCQRASYQYETTILRWEEWGEKSVSALKGMELLEARRSFPNNKTASGTKP